MVAESLRLRVMLTILAQGSGCARTYRVLSQGIGVVHSLFVLCSQHIVCIISTCYGLNESYRLDSNGLFTQRVQRQDFMKGNAATGGARYPRRRETRN